MSERMVRMTLFVMVGALAGAAAGAADARVEQVPELCPGLSSDERPIVAVMDFKVKVDVTGDVGGGMASMLSNALLNSGCFTVVERARLDDVMNEQAFGLSGAVEESSAAGVGQIKGARYQVMGEITEFSENESGVGGAVRSVGRFMGGRRGAAAGSVDVRNAHVGFIIKVVDTSSAIVIGSQSFDKKRTSAGLAGAGWSGSTAFAGAGQISKAMADAIEEGIIEATRSIVPYRDRMVTSSPELAGPAAPEPGECALLRAASRPPKVMVVIPEEHILGQWGAYGEGRAFKFDEYEGRRDGSGSTSAGSDALAAAQRMIRPPDPAGETEIVKRFIEHGFHLVDEAQLDKLEEEQRWRMINDDVALAASIGKELGADIVITGEAFSEFSKNINGLMSCRARVEAKAIEARTGRIIATDGLHGSAVDVSEVTAGKTALRNAGGKVADYFLTQLCAETGLAALGSGGPAAGAGAGTTDLIVSNIDFMGSTQLQSALEALTGVSGVEKTSFQSGTASFRVTHSGSADELAQAMVSAAGAFPIEITALEGRRIVAKRK